ncbi:tumor necrosis factor receptor superfamily member 8 [Panthera uncia]|uniref:tumor necrosis factor receptor superfamily member 8 n=1 Tax=Panthera uncia TaxID=29064 RepID=UPI0020FFCF2A|nr:tumor necrosis factor receptor superfamily member 8 [Panthera uncia]
MYYKAMNLNEWPPSATMPGLDNEWRPGLLGPEGQERGCVSGTRPVSPIYPILQDRVPRDVYAGDPGHHHDKTAGRCCHCCPVGDTCHELAALDLNRPLHQKSESKEKGYFPGAFVKLSEMGLIGWHGLAYLRHVAILESSGGRVACQDATGGRAHRAGLPCPQGSPDCRKQCEPDYYLNRDGRCTACVSCARDDLVEKMPCSGNSSRVCECRAGTFCATSATNSCARCIPHTVCPKGMIVKVQGTAQMDTVCERPSPVTSPDLGTGPEDCQAPTSDTSAQAGPLVTSSVSSSARTTLLGGGTAITPEDDSKTTGAPGSPSSVRKPSPDPGNFSRSFGLFPRATASHWQATCVWHSGQVGLSWSREKRVSRSLGALGFEGQRCTACVSCARDDLVEKTPCTWNSSCVCECRPGMFCVTPVTNSCAHCVTRPVCPPGMATKPQGTAERDATHEPPPPLEAHPECSTNPEDSKAPTSATASPVSAADPQGSKEHGGGNTHTWGDTFTSTSSPISFSSTGKPILVSGPVLFWMVMILVVVLVSISFLLCHWRACRKWIRQKLHLCYPAQTFRPTLEPVDSRPRRNLTQLRSCISVAEPGTEELGLMGPPAMETCPNGEVCLESMRLLDASPAGSPPSPRDLPEPRVTSEHTNNRIEKIYIMKADTVIVGTVRTELPEGRGLAGPTGPELEEDLEGDHAYPHFPEQETEPPLGSCGDVMFSVEEEGKEAPLPMTVSEK